jgi:transposase
LTKGVINAIIVVTMFIDSAVSIQRGKTYARHLLRDSYREDGKVKHRTLANLSRCSEEEIGAIKLALKHKGHLASLGNIKELKTRLGTRIGAVYCLRALAERIGLLKALGNTPEGKLALWQVLARLIGQGSRLRAVRLAESHAACDVLGLDAFNEDHLYANLNWVSEKQEAIEMRLFRQRYGDDQPQLFLYDVTSSYLEGTQNILAAFGYNRDGKKGKMQLVIGLLEGPDGNPLAVRVFEGNTKDTKTVAEQIQILAKGFGVSGVTLVGDRGMIKYPEIKRINARFFHYITAITKPQIRTLLREGVFQMGLFEDKLCEIENDGIRYILRRNPGRAREINASREDRLAAVQTILEQKNCYLAEHPRARVRVAQKEVETRINKLKIADWVKVNHNGTRLEIVIDENAGREIAELDGCYVIKTDVPAGMATAAMIHERYKDLALVEEAFRSFKKGLLRVQPTYVRTEASTRGHVFVVMLAYLLERELDKYWHKLDVTAAEGIAELSSIRGIEIELEQVACQKVPEATGLSLQLLKALDIKLPEVLPPRKVHVATRKNLVSGRN